MAVARWVNAFRARQDVGDGALRKGERVELDQLRKENQGGLSR